ncbi:flagellar protein FliS [Desulfohalotomaculum tongense]|uniref:flagellar export chaperone FliS n=1 Tax=Desulforadius tongensis TaxID=1216062 RepID=UPI00195AAD3B|nr:flagellar export chaperone FliS [Desulforadius tongensis]MBM7854201.1 flagellar protein FliS [Desulforadius tongensis]
MQMQNPYAQYRQNAVNSAEPGELTLMLYNGAVKFNKLAVKQLEDKNLEKANYYIQRVEDIITELMVTLNRDYEISNNLFSLYDYIKRRLVEANVKKDRQILLEVQDFLEELRSTWAEALKQVKSSGVSGSGGK